MELNTSDPATNAADLVAHPGHLNSTDPDFPVMDESLQPASQVSSGTSVEEALANQIQHELAAERSRSDTECTEHGDDNASVQSELSDHDFVDGLFNGMLGPLDAITSSGTFANSHRLGEMHPGLVVKNVGPVYLPLREDQAKQIIATARQAPYGNGSETIVDTSVRNTWELDPSQFCLTDQLWPTFVAALCQEIAVEAGLGDVQVHADLYKMLIYEKGAMFKAHTDTEKIPGMFGTLVICLPSPHEGGHVVTKHRGVSKTFMTDDTPQSYIWWFSDVSHEVLPVTSGYRVVLTYNLAIDPSRAISRPSAALAHNEAKPLRRALRRWLAQPKQDREADYLYYALDHQYTEANISRHRLKTRDLAVVDVLHQLSATLPFHVFLVALEKGVNGSCEYERDYRRSKWNRYDDDYDDDEEDHEGFHDLEEVFDTSYNIKKLVDLDGQELGRDTGFDLDNVIQAGEDLFPEDPDDEDYEGYMGNSGPSATHWYRASAVAIVPRDHLVAYLSSVARYGSLSTVTDYIAEVCLDLVGSNRSDAFRTWTTFYEEIFKQRGGMSKATEDTKGLVLLTTLRMKDLGLWNDIIISMAGGKHDLPDWFFSDVCEEVLKGEVTFDQIEEGMSALINVLPTLDRQYDVVAEFVALERHDSTENMDAVRVLLETWPRQVFARILAEDRPLGKGDGESMVEIALQWCDLAFFKEVTVPIFRKRIRDFGFSIEYLNQFRIHIEAGYKLDYDEVNALYRSLVTFLIDDIDAALLHSTEGLDARIAATTPARGSYLYGLSVQRNDQTVLQADRRNTVTHGDLLAFMEGILAADLPSLTLLKLFLKLTDQADRIDAAEFQPLWMPFLHDFVPFLERSLIPLTTPRYQHFCAAILEAYIRNYVKKEPQETSSLAQRKVSCHCGDCAQLNAFLMDPNRNVGRFAVGKQRRHHLHQQLDSARIDCVHKTERRGQPQTLVVTKTLAAQVKAHAEWKRRADRAREEFESFDQDQLRTLLGPDFLKITNLDEVRAVSSQQQTPANLALPPSQSQVQPSTQPAAGAQPAQIAPPQNHGIPQQHARSFGQPLPAPSPNAPLPPYQSPYLQRGVSAQQGLPPALQPQQPAGVSKVGSSSNPAPPQPASGPKLGVLSSISGNLPQGHSYDPVTRQGWHHPKLEEPSPARPQVASGQGFFYPGEGRGWNHSKLEFHSPGTLTIKQENGRKRRAGEIESEVIARKRKAIEIEEAEVIDLTSED